MVDRMNRKGRTMYDILGSETPSNAAPAMRRKPRYEFNEVLGAGGMGHVYRAWDTVEKRDVAVKLFSSSASADVITRREREIMLLSTLRHPNIVNVHDSGTTLSADGCRFMVMEYMEAGTLQNRLSGGALDESIVASVGAQIADALAYLHRRAIAHLDVKPGNLLLSEERGVGVTAKLSDFDIARYVGDESADENVILGTATYLSPEQALGEPVATASDIYSLGLVLLEALTGRREYEGTEQQVAIARLLRDPSIPDALSPEWRELLAAMTARDAASRPTADAVAASLRQILTPAPAAAPEGLGRRARRSLANLFGQHHTALPA
jgi:serine/threonine protein kinase